MARQLVDQGEEITIFRIYSMALYVSATMIVHPHVLPPQNSGETLPFVILIFIGGLLWTGVLSRTTALMTSMDRHSIVHHQTMDDLNLLTSDKGLPHPLRRRLRLYFLSIRNHSQDQTWQQLQEKMSPALRTEVSYQICKIWIRRLYYFRNVSKLFLQNITSQMKNSHFSQGETFGDNFVLYILKVGLVSWSKGQSKFIMLRSGSVWGDEHLFLNNPELLQPNTVTTMTFVEVVSLDRKIFKAVCEEYPEYIAQFHRVYLHYAFLRTIRWVVQQERLKNVVYALSQAKHADCSSDMDHEDARSDHGSDVQNHALQVSKMRRSVTAKLSNSSDMRICFRKDSLDSTSQPLRTNSTDTLKSQSIWSNVSSEIKHADGSSDKDHGSDHNDHDSDVQHHAIQVSKMRKAMTTQLNDKNDMRMCFRSNSKDTSQSQPIRSNSKGSSQSQSIRSRSKDTSNSAPIRRNSKGNSKSQPIGSTSTSIGDSDESGPNLVAPSSDTEHSGHGSDVEVKFGRTNGIGVRNGVGEEKNLNLAATSSAGVNRYPPDSGDRLTQLEERLSRGFHDITAQTTALEDLISRKFQQLLEGSIGIAPTPSRSRPCPSQSHLHENLHVSSILHSDKGQLDDDECLL